MDPFIMMSILSAGGQLMAGSAAQSAAQLNAFNMDTEKVLSETEALQRHNDRLDLYRSNLSANIASFAAKGRDVGADRSVGTFLQEQQNIATDDTARSDFMGMMQASKLQSQASAVRAEGRAAMTSALVGAFTTMYEGYTGYNQARVPSGSSAQAAPTISQKPVLRNSRPRSSSLYTRASDFFYPRG